MASFLAKSDGFLMRHRPSPSDEHNHRSDKLFWGRLDEAVRSHHPLARLADWMPWDSIVKQVADLLTPAPEGAGLASLPLRMMVGLLYLQYAYNISDDQVLERWLESPYMQYFTGKVYFQHVLPCDPSSRTRWRNRLDEAGALPRLAADPPLHVRLVCAERDLLDAAYTWDRHARRILDGIVKLNDQ